MLDRVLAFTRGILRRRSIAQEADDELAFHLEEETARQQALGASPQEARRLAAISLGSVAVVRDEVADVRTFQAEVLWRELRVGVRALLAAPSFSLPAIAVLALGLGGATAIFSVLDGVLWRPLPFPEPDQLVRVWSRNDARQVVFLSVMPADVEDWRARSAARLQVGAYERPQVVPPAQADGEPTAMMRVSPNVFALLGVPAARGRTLDWPDTRVPVAVISDDLWRTRFSGAADVLGRGLVLGSQSMTIVGVMPPRFAIPNAEADVWLPLDTDVPPPDRYSHTLRVIVRAPRRDAAATVKRDLDAIAAQLGTERPANNAGWSVTVQPLFDTVVSPELRQSLGVTAGAVLFLLLMATSSVAGLLLGRSASRERELAVRVALGGSRGSLVRLLLLESLVIAGVAGALGLLVSAWALTWLRNAGGLTIPRLEDVSVNGRVFLAAAAMSVVVALAAGVLPAWRSTRSLQDRLRSRGDVAPHRAGRSLQLLVVVEMACAVLLVVGAALLAQTVRNLHARPLGFDPDRLLSIGVLWPADAPEAAQRTADLDGALERLAGVPGIAAAAATSALPFAGQNSGNVFTIDGQADSGQQPPDTDYRVVSADYFAALGMPVQRGRVFAAADRTAGVVVISQTAAARYWAGQDPVGSRLKLGPSDWLTVTGVVGDVRYGGLGDPDDRVRPMMYVPYWQMPGTPVNFVARTSMAPSTLADTVRLALADARGMRVGRVESVTAMVRDASASQRFSMSLVSAFAGCAVLLAAVGLYGLLALVVGRRTREFALRCAVGATPWDLLRRLTGFVFVLSAVGIALGVGMSLWLSGVVRAVLFGISPNDLRTYVLVAVGFGVLALGASVIPIRRALRVDVLRAMQTE